MSDDQPPRGPDELRSSPSAPSRKRRAGGEPLRVSPSTDPEAARLSLEIRTYQAELESQNEELRQAQVALDTARARYRDLYDSAPVALVTVGLQGKILTCNRRASDLLGLSPWMGHRRLVDFMHGTSAAAFERERARLLSGGEPATIQVVMSRPGNGTVRVEMTMSLAREESDGSLVCQIALSDVTERARLREDVGRLAAIVDSAVQAIVSEDLNAIVTSWNAGAERLFGYSSSEVIGHSIELLVPPDRLAEEREIQSRARALGTHVHETIRRRADGTIVHVLVATAPILGDDGRIVGISHIAQDITKQVEARHEIQRLLRDMREADQRKDTFIATLAHELRNPLAPIRNAAAVLRFTPDLDPKLQWCRDVIDRQVKHMSALLEDLLDVSRLTRDTILLRWDRIELGTVIVQAVETARPLIEGRHHKLSLDLPREPIEIEGDLNRVIQIFGNLLSNAAKYTHRGGDISVRAVRHGDEVVVSVRDNGIGIDPSQLERVFELFSQIDPKSEASEGGLGIGLALVKGLVERHRGTVVAHSDGLGRGSEFVVCLPVATAAASTSLSSASPRRQAETVDHSRRVLVVDDNVDAAESMAIVLRLEGYEVRTAHDGEHALSVAAEYRPELMLLDIGMPRMNGYEVARRLRQEAWGRDTLLIACTGWGQPEDRRRSKAAGFDEHLVKPVSPEAIVQLFDTLSRPKRD